MEILNKAEVDLDSFEEGKTLALDLVKSFEFSIITFFFRQMLLNWETQIVGKQD